MEGSKAQAELRRRRRRRARLTFAVLIAFSVGGLGWLLAQSSFLDLETVAVTPGAHTAAEVVREAAALEVGEPLLFIDRGAVARRIEKLPWVERATVKRSLPGTLRVTIHERDPVAWIRRGAEPDAGLALVDASGRILDHRTVPPSGLPELVFEARVGEPGAQLQRGAPRHATDALRIAATVPDALAGRVLAIDPTTTGWVLRLDVAEVVRLGTVRDFADLAEKWSALLAVVEHLGDRSVYLVDVRAPSVPSVREEKAAPTTVPPPAPSPPPAPPAPSTTAPG